MLEVDRGLCQPGVGGILAQILQAVRRMASAGVLSGNLSMISGNIIMCATLNYTVVYLSAVVSVYLDL